MRASQLIGQLQALVAEHGDLECVQIRDDNYMVIPIDCLNHEPREALERCTTHGFEDEIEIAPTYFLIGDMPMEYASLEIGKQ